VALGPGDGQYAFCVGTLVGGGGKLSVGFGVGVGIDNAGPDELPPQPAATPAHKSAKNTSVFRCRVLTRRALPRPGANSSSQGPRSVAANALGSMWSLERRALGALLIGGVAAVVLGAAPGTLTQVSAQVPPPTPSPTQAATPVAEVPTAAPTPSPTPTPAPSRHGHHRASSSASPGATAQPSPTATPTSPAFSTLDGNWEVQVQTFNGTSYSRFAMHQDGSNIVGTWYVTGKQLPFTGSYDGRLFRLIVKDEPGTVNLSGYIENSTDMVGIIDNGKGDLPGANPIAFTAEHHVPSKPGLFGGSHERSSASPSPKPQHT